MSYKCVLSCSCIVQTMEVQTTNSDCVYVLSVFHPLVTFAETVAIFTNYERAIHEQRQLQEALNEYWKRLEANEGVTYISFIKRPKYNAPIADVTKVAYSDFDKMNPKYVEKEEELLQSFNNMPYTGRGCWFDYLKKKQIDCDERNGDIIETYENNKGVQTRFPEMYVVTHFHGGNDANKSELIGIYTNPKLAHNVQASVLHNNGRDVLFSTFYPTIEHGIERESFVELVAFEHIDPKTVTYRRL